MKVSDVMTSPILTVLPGTTVRELWKLLFAKHVNALPVVDSKGKLVGIITKEDVLKALYPSDQEYFADLSIVSNFVEMEEKIKDLGNLKANDVMGKRVVFTRSDTPVMRALSRMIVRRLNQLPVVTEDERVIGMVTKGDIFYALVKREMKKDDRVASAKEKLARRKTAKK
jgi:CBS domain-containing protein